MTRYKKINGAQDYVVGDDGSVWRKLKPCHNGRMQRIRNYKHRRPYINIKMDDGAEYEFKIHQLVAECFLGPQPPDKPFVLHKDDDIWNNISSNLYYGTNQQNCHDRGDNGTRTLTRADVKAIRASNLGDTALGRQYGVNRKTIWSIKNYRTWTDI